MKDKNKDLWRRIINVVITILTAIATTITTQSCMTA